MTDRDRLIELIKNADNDKNLEWYDLYDLCCGKGCAEYFADYLLANSVTVNEWRPASEPPKKDGAYICVIKQWSFSNDICVVLLNYTHGVFLNDYDNIQEVFYWMPLPNPPKEVE